MHLTQSKTGPPQVRFNEMHCAKTNIGNFNFSLKISKMTNYSKVLLSIATRVEAELLKLSVCLLYWINFIQ